MICGALNCAGELNVGVMKHLWCSGCPGGKACPHRGAAHTDTWGSGGWREGCGGIRGLTGFTLNHALLWIFFFILSAPL